MIRCTVSSGDSIPVGAGLAADHIIHKCYRNTRTIVRSHYCADIRRRNFTGAAHCYGGWAGNGWLLSVVHCNCK